MKNLIKIYALFAFAFLSFQPITLSAFNTENNILSVKEECVSDNDIINYVKHLGYNNPQIAEEIGCDRIVRTNEVLLYVYVAGGRIVGAEIIGN